MKLIDLKSLSEQTSLSVSTYRQYLKKGMPHYRLGRKVLIDPEEFESWFRQFHSGARDENRSLDKLIDNALEEMKAGSS